MLQLEFNVINFDDFCLVEDLSEVQKHIMARFAFRSHAAVSHIKQEDSPSERFG